MTLTRTIQLWTDFHSPTKTGVHVSTIGVGGGTLLRPDVGDEVTLFDGEGNSCLGVVEAVFDVNGYVLVHTRAVPGTWQTEGPAVDLMNALRGSVEAAKEARRLRGGRAETKTEKAEDTKIAV